MNSKNIFLPHQKNFNHQDITLPASKSISNRALIIAALSPGSSIIHNLSEARDTQTMNRLLTSDEDILDVLDAGTTMRFLTAYLAFTNQQKVLTGSHRMQERPIGILVDALKTLGANIDYTKNEGYPPLRISGYDQNKSISELEIRGDISSQFISAIMMIAPLLSSGLSINLLGKIGSKPYITMTQKVMRHYGVESLFEGHNIKIDHQQYVPKDFIVEPDWSAASYWYSFIALSENSTVTLKGLQSESLQGDRSIVEIMSELGVSTKFNEKGATLSKIQFSDKFSYDFTHCPDLAQTVAVICAANKVGATLKGLESLKIKETDRIAALQKQLSKLGATLEETGDSWTLTPSQNIPNSIFIETYDDHRMAMAFAPLLTRTSVEIENLEVVNKSYPRYWEDLRAVGLTADAVD